MRCSDRCGRTCRRSGSVAITSWSAVRLHPGESSGGNLEELVHKADLIAYAWLAREAVSAPDHSHDLETLDRGRRSLDGLEASYRLMTCFNAPWSASIRLFRYFNVRCLVSLGSWPSRFSLSIASGYERSLSVVMDTGGQLRMTVSAFARKRCAARVFRRSESMKSMSTPCLATAPNRYFHLPPTLT